MSDIGIRVGVAAVPLLPLALAWLVRRRFAAWKRPVGLAALAFVAQSVKGRVLGVERKTASVTVAECNGCCPADRFERACAAVR
ncbi:MAG: hypothetical protein EPO01_14715 [Aquabacterium sp.]|nr:MAG: hypothetical protein EPO01_14715 [Aquabacterium sp.]